MPTPNAPPPRATYRNLARTVPPKRKSRSRPNLPAQASSPDCRSSFLRVTAALTSRHVPIRPCTHLDLSARSMENQCGLTDRAETTAL